MISHIYSATHIGFDGRLIDVECDASKGLPSLIIVGLGNKAIEEAKERVRSAIKNTGLEFPRKRITINLAPADLPKDGVHFDLAIALALLSMSGQIKQASLNKTLVVGELSLDGSLRPIRGIISHIETARKAGLEAVIIPAQNYHQASLVTGMKLLPASSLKEVMDYLIHNLELTPPPQPTAQVSVNKSTATLEDVHGQEQAKRALLIAAAGHHNILFDGPPGAGKTLLAKTLTSILPPLTADESIQATKLHSMAGVIDDSILTQRPFRSPHHSASHNSLIGGGTHPKPGEISLAHCGVLFLDELPEYSQMALEALRQPLEDKQVHIARTHSRVSYPADFMLVATQNPCPCGFANDQTRDCTCSAFQIQRYRKKLSGPLLDRIDLYIQVSRVDTNKLLNQSAPKIDYPGMVAAARVRQAERFGIAGKTNAHLTNDDIKTSVFLTNPAQSLLNHAAEKLSLSARGYFKVIKVARTIADLEASEGIEQQHISEALQYRNRG